MPALDDSPRRVSHSSANRELLICNVLEAVGARRKVMSGRLRSRELELLLRDVTPVGSVVEEKTSSPASLPGGGSPPHTDDLGDRDQCFSCGHGVNRCPRLDRYFPYKMPGWSVDVRDGQYRASRIRGDEQDLRQGKEGWFGREGQPPGPSVTVTCLTQGGGGGHHPAWKRPKDDTHGPRWTPDAQGFPVLGIAATVRCRIVLQLCWRRIQT